MASMDRVEALRENFHYNQIWKGGLYQMTTMTGFPGRARLEHETNSNMKYNTTKMIYQLATNNLQ